MDLNRLAELQAKYGLSYHVPWLLEADHEVGLRGKTVLEIGGRLPRELVIEELGVAQWIAIDSDMSHLRKGQENDGPLLNLRQITATQGIVETLSDYALGECSVEELPECLFGRFDVVISFAVFEHILHFPRALDRMYECLKPGGRLFSQFSPIWSAHNGHHLLSVTDRAGRQFEFHDVPIPPWGHLTLSPPELYHHLLGHTDAEAADEIVFCVHHAPHINRLFVEDYVGFVLGSRFQIGQVQGAFSTPPSPELQAVLEARWPGRKHFAFNGLRLLLTKP